MVFKKNYILSWWCLSSFHSVLIQPLLGVFLHFVLSSAIHSMVSFFISFCLWPTTLWCLSSFHSVLGQPLHGVFLHSILSLANRYMVSFFIPFSHWPTAPWCLSSFHSLIGQPLHGVFLHSILSLANRYMVSCCTQFCLFPTTPLCFLISVLFLAIRSRSSSIPLCLCPWSTCPWCSSSVQDGVCALGKAHMRSTPSLGGFPNVAFETVLTA